MVCIGSLTICLLRYDEFLTIYPPTSSRRSYTAYSQHAAFFITQYCILEEVSNVRTPQQPQVTHFALLASLRLQEKIDKSNKVVVCAEVSWIFDFVRM